MGDPGHSHDQTVEFPIEEFEVLKRLVHPNHKLEPNLERAYQQTPRSKFIVSFSTIDIQALRDLLADQVTKVGFDASYKLTGYGQVLETMIDRLPL